MATRSRSQSLCLSKFHHGTIKWPLPCALAIALSSIPETPASYTIANQYLEWRVAMAQEFHACIANQPWSLVPASQAPNIVTCKWVFRTKRLANDSIERRKAYLVAKGFLQEFEIDFEEAFGLVVKAMTICTILAIAVSQHWFIQQYDVQNAFMHGPLHETLFISQPPRFSHPQYPSHVCRLNKAIYRFW